MPFRCSRQGSLEHAFEVWVRVFAWVVTFIKPEQNRVSPVDGSRRTRSNETGIETTLKIGARTCLGSFDAMADADRLVASDHSDGPNSRLVTAEVAGGHR
jgi:hypothetical protein